METNAIAKKFQTDLNSLGICLTNTCNQNCNYCVSNAIQSCCRGEREETREAIYKEVPYIINKAKLENFRITWSGGEPGIVSDEIIEFMLSHNIDIINTNGLLLRNEVFLASKNRPKIVYHIAPEIKKDLYIRPIKCYNVVYLIVIHKLNYHYLKDFLELNSHLNFEIELNCLQNPRTIEQLKTILLPQDIVNIKEILSTVSNINQAGKSRIDRALNKVEVEETKQLCRARKNVFFCIDEKIIRSCINCEFDPINELELTRQKIDFTLEVNKEYTIPKMVCKDCTRYLDNLYG